MSESVRLRSRKGRVSRRQVTHRNSIPRMGVEELERRELLAGSLGATVHFDFGTSTSPAATGYQEVPLVAYSATRGYGWGSISGMSARDRGTADALTRDVHIGHDKTFRANLDSGTYDVTVTLGDATVLRDNVSVWIEGQRVATGLSTAAGQFVRPTYRVSVADGQLTLRLVDGGGVNANFAIAGLDAVQVGAAPPVANAGADFTADEGAARTFAGTRTGGTAPFTYLWNFGDGRTVSGSLTPTHTYADNGTYTVTLTVTDATGLVSQDTAVATIRNVAPTVSAGGPYSGVVGTPATFAGTATDPGVTDSAAGFTYAWDFGDGATSSQRVPSHSYAAPGSYPVTLRVTDKDGGTGTATTTATITGTGGGSLANVGLTAGWATFGQALPQGAAFGGLQLGSLVTQTDVKTLWPDGSIRFAVVSASVPANGVYPLSAAGAATTSSFTVEPLGAWVYFEADGTTYNATPPAAATGDLWLSGPLVSESRWTVSPVDPFGNAHPYLSVIFDVRSYVDGQSRLDVTVENTLNSTIATSATYNVWVGVGTETFFQRTGVMHAYLTRWRQTFDVNLTASQVTPDFSPAYAAQALPRYRSLVANEVNAPVGPAFDILGAGSLNPYMPDHGGRQEIAPYPDWAARYLVHEDPTQGQYVLAHGNLAGSWPIHIREQDSSLVSIDQRPNFWFYNTEGDGPQGWPDPIRPYWYEGIPPAPFSPLTPDNAHQPSLAYIPYLMTGDRYYADEMAFWADFVLLSTWQDDYYNARHGSEGILEPNEVRGIAWGLRNLVDAAAYLPDADPMKAHFAQKIQNNLVWLDDYAASQINPLGVMWTSKRLETSDPALYDRAWIGLWEQNYLAWAIDHANKQGFVGGLLHRDKIVQLQNALFSDPALRDGGAPYVLPVGDQVPPGSGQISWYTSISQMYQGPVDFIGYYGVDARMSLMLGIESGMAGAQEAYDYLDPILSADSLGFGSIDLASRAGWALALPWEA